MKYRKKYCAKCKKEANPPMGFGMDDKSYCEPCAMEIYNSRPHAGLVATSNRIIRSDVA
jgi:hypothetical protein